MIIRDMNATKGLIQNRILVCASQMEENLIGYRSNCFVFASCTF